PTAPGICPTAGAASRGPENRWPGGTRATRTASADGEARGAQAAETPTAGTSSEGGGHVTWRRRCRTNHGACCFDNPASIACDNQSVTELGCIAVLAVPRGGPLWSSSFHLPRRSIMARQGFDAALLQHLAGSAEARRRLALILDTLAGQRTV